MDYLCYKLSELPPGTADLSQLPVEEQELCTRRGRAYLLTRCLLRQELARRLNTAPQSIKLEYSQHGKPGLPGHPLHFNLSHSADLLCLAFHHAPVGIDVQELRPRTVSERLAERIMCPKQLKKWQQRGKSPEEFFTCWCIAEALVKHAASTIWQAKDYPFLIHESHVQTLYENAPTLRVFHPAPGYLGAVAYDIPSCQKQHGMIKSSDPIR